MADKTFLDYALLYAKRGWAVFPLKPKDKKPLTSNGFKDATIDAKQIKKWWTQNPNANIGIATGNMSNGLLVIDFDVHDDLAVAERYLREWQDENGNLPLTMSSKTGSGGVHLLYQVNRSLKNSTNKDFQIDTRCDGGYIVAPPSIHPTTGKAYEWRNEDLGVAQASDLVYKFVADVKKKDKLSSAKYSNFTLPARIGKGERNDVMFRYCASLQSKGMTDQAIYLDMQAINSTRIDPPLPASELKQIYNSVIKRYSKGTGINTTAISSDDWRNFLLTCKNNKGQVQVTNDLTNYVTVLKNDEVLADHFFFDVRASQIMVEKGLPAPFLSTGQTRSVKDVDYSALQIYLERLPFATGSPDKMFKQVKKDKCMDAIEQVALSNPRNLAQEYFQDLVWDGHPRAETLLVDFLGAEDDAYTRAVTRLLLNGTYARANIPGVKFDYIPVLIGRQGLGKSQFCKALCPNELWYLDGLNTMEGDEAIEKIRNKLVVEVSELASLRKDKLETVKAFLTRTVDTIRPKYAKNTEDRPRSCVFIGTTNVSQFLVDKTGNRRWLPVKCGVQQPTLSLFHDETTSYFDQVWAEVAYWNDGAKDIEKTLILPLNIQAEAESRQRRALEDDPRIGLIHKYLGQKASELKNNITCNPDAGRVCSWEIAEFALALDRPSKYDIKDINTIMETNITDWIREPTRKNFRKYGKQIAYTPTAEAIENAGITESGVEEYAFS